jgi:hypothetical protein
MKNKSLIFGTAILVASNLSADMATKKWEIDNNGWIQKRGSSENSILIGYNQNTQSEIKFIDKQTGETTCIIDDNAIQENQKNIFSLAFNNIHEEGIAFTKLDGGQDISAVNENCQEVFKIPNSDSSAVIRPITQKIESANGQYFIKKDTTNEVLYKYSKDGQKIVEQDITTKPTNSNYSTEYYSDMFFKENFTFDEDSSTLFIVDDANIKAIDSSNNNTKWEYSYTSNSADFDYDNGSIIIALQNEDDSVNVVSLKNNSTSYSKNFDINITNLTTPNQDIKILGDYFLVGDFDTQSVKELRNSDDGSLICKTNGYNTLSSVINSDNTISFLNISDDSSMTKKYNIITMAPKVGISIGKCKIISTSENYEFYEKPKLIKRNDGSLLIASAGSKSSIYSISNNKNIKTIDYADLLNKDYFLSKVEVSTDVSNIELMTTTDGTLVSQTIATTDSNTKIDTYNAVFDEKNNMLFLETYDSSNQPKNLIAYQVSSNSNSTTSSTTSYNPPSIGDSNDTKSFEDGINHVLNNLSTYNLTQTASSITNNYIDSLPTGWSLLGSSNDINDTSIFDNSKVIWRWINNGWEAYSPDTNIQNTLDGKYPKIETLPANSGFWLLK